MLRAHSGDDHDDDDDDESARVSHMFMIF